MKKTLLLGLLALAGFTANAQLANGSTAPDFTATDINGNTIHLYEYLNQGKTVIIDISATWCGPCWSYHSTHALENLYNGYGPNGSDEVMVIFIEGDGSTTMADLQGTGNNTQGNWTTGPYPIIDSASIANLYQITYFPTVYRICPDGFVTEVGAQNAVNLKNGIQNASGCAQTLAGADNHAELWGSEARICNAGDMANFTLDFKNFGKNTITSAVATLMENGNAVATADFTGSVSTYNSGTVSFSDVAVNGASDYTVAFTQINAQTPYSSPFNAGDVVEVEEAILGNNELYIEVYTDNYPSEISWTIKDGNNNTVASGGPYQAGTADQWGGGGPDANTVKTHTVTLPEGLADCFTVEFHDAFGDGWIYGSTPHGMKIYSVGQAEPVFNYNAGATDFGNLLEIPSAFKSSGEFLATQNVTTTKFAVYPNPSNGVFNFNSTEELNVTVTDLTGKVVFTANEVPANGSINLSQLQQGMYIAQIKGETFEKTEKLVIK